MITTTYLPTYRYLVNLDFMQLVHVDAHVQTHHRQSVAASRRNRTASRTASCTAGRTASRTTRCCTARRCTARRCPARRHGRRKNHVEQGTSATGVVDEHCCYCHYSFCPALLLLPASSWPLAGWWWCEGLRLLLPLLRTCWWGGGLGLLLQQM